MDDKVQRARNIIELTEWAQSQTLSDSAKLDLLLDKMPDVVDSNEALLLLEKIKDLDA